MKIQTFFLFVGLFTAMLLTNISIFAQKTTWKVKTAGAMREMFETGDIDGKTDVSKITTQTNLYAVGPLENLSGEIMIWNGESWTSFIKDNHVVVERNPKAKAVFFVWSNVEKWTEISIPNSVKTYNELEKFIAESAVKNNLNSSEALPFRLSGKFETVDWHINDYKSDGGELTREKHDKLKFKSKSENANLEMIGFYSPKHQGIFTHHTRTSHIHVTDEKRTFIGHVDDLKLNGAIKLFLPRN